MKTALVTGSAGFIGTHFVERLVLDGWEIRLCDTAYPFPNSIDCRRYFAESEQQFDLVLHCAANVGGRAKIDGDPMGIAENLALDQAALSWAVRTRPHHFVYFSSSAAYPVYLQQGKKYGAAYIDQRQLKESDIDLELPELSDQMYGEAKLMGERMVKIAQAAGVTCHVFRPFSGYGCDQSTDYPFGAFVDRAKRQERPFVVWGDGSAVRDWIHVDDIVEAVLCAVDGDLAGPYNLCTGTGTTFDTLARMVTKIAGYEPLLEKHPEKPSGVAHRVGDPAKLHEFYTPKICLQEGVERALHPKADVVSPPPIIRKPGPPVRKGTPIRKPQ